MTNSEFVSRIINDINALNLDAHVSRRYILRIGALKAESWIARRWDEGGLFGEDSLYTYIDCLEMIPIDRIECKCLGLSFPNCNILMRSKHQIPGLLYGRYGSLISMVSSINREILFHETNIKSLNNNRKRRFGHIKKPIYYVLDGYLFIPDYEVEVVSIVLVTTKKAEIEELFGCNGKTEDCKSGWDFEFVCPARVREYVFSETLNEILGSKMQIPIDEQPDGDINIKSVKSN